MAAFLCTLKFTTAWLAATSPAMTVERFVPDALVLQETHFHNCKEKPLAIGQGSNIINPVSRYYRTSTLRNCHGSLSSMSSGKKPGRSASGVQSV